MFRHAIACVFRMRVVVSGAWAKDGAGGVSARAAARANEVAGIREVATARMVALGGLDAGASVAFRTDCMQGSSSG